MIFFSFSPIFFLRIGLDLRALVKSCSPNIKKKRFFLADKKIYFWNFGFFEKKSHLLTFFEIFGSSWQFLIFFKKIWVYMEFVGFCWIFLGFLFLFFWIFLNFWDGLIFLWTYFILFYFFGLFSKLLRLLLNVTEVTTEHQKWSKISTNSVKSFFCPKGKTSFVRRPKLSAGAWRKPA